MTVLKNLRGYFQIPRYTLYMVYRPWLQRTPPLKNTEKLNVGCVPQDSYHNWLSWSVPAQRCLYPLNNKMPWGLCSGRRWICTDRRKDSDIFCSYFLKVKVEIQEHSTGVKEQSWGINYIGPIINPYWTKSVNAITTLLCLSFEIPQKIKVQRKEQPNTEESDDRKWALPKKEKHMYFHLNWNQYIMKSSTDDKHDYNNKHNRKTSFNNLIYHDLPHIQP